LPAPQLPTCRHPPSAGARAPARRHTQPMPRRREPARFRHSTPAKRGFLATPQQVQVIAHQIVTVGCPSCFRIELEPAF
jgi:hypothetical protein